MEGTAREEGQGGLVSFLTEALRPVFSRELVLPALLLALLLTVSNIVIVRNAPMAGVLPWQFVAAAIVRLGAILVFAVAILRILTGSDRPPWRPDGALWLYGLTMIAGIAISALARFPLEGRSDLLGLLLISILVTVILSPFVAWVVAIAVARPLAWRPGPFMRAFGLWLPHLVFWSLLLLTPLAVLHAWLDHWLVLGAGEWFWTVALIDGPLSAAMALLGLGLNAAAYRRVAHR